MEEGEEGEEEEEEDAFDVLAEMMSEMFAVKQVGLALYFTSNCVVGFSSNCVVLQPEPHQEGPQAGPASGRQHGPHRKPQGLRLEAARS